MAGIDSVLAQLGYEPGGATKRSPLEQIAGGLETLNEGFEKQRKKREEYKKNQFDMYKTLRDAGYDNEEAWEAAIKGVIPSNAPTGEGDVASELKKLQVEEQRMKNQKLQKELELDKASMEYQKVTAQRDAILNNTEMDEMLKQQQIDLLDAKEEELRNKLSNATYDKDTLNRAAALRREFNTSQISKDYQTISRSFKALETAYNASTSKDAASLIASDQALGVLFQKLLDPQSVVRESEYARTPEGAAFMNRMASILPQMQKGGLKLRDVDRKALYDQAAQLMHSAAKTYNDQIDNYSLYAQKYQIPDPTLVIGNVKKIEIPGEREAVEQMIANEQQAAVQQQQAMNQQQQAVDDEIANGWGLSQTQRKKKPNISEGYKKRFPGMK